jgi:hypothetical protein
MAIEPNRPIRTKRYFTIIDDHNTAIYYRDPFMTL